MGAAQSTPMTVSSDQTSAFSASSSQAVRGNQYEARCCPDCFLHSCECPQQQQDVQPVYGGYGAGYGSYDASAYGGYGARYGGYGGAYGGYGGYGASAYGDYSAHAYGTKAQAEPANHQPTCSEPTLDSSPALQEQSPELGSQALTARAVEAEVELERLYEVLEEAQLNIQMRTEQIREMAEQQAASSALLYGSTQTSIPLESTQQWQAINGALDELETARGPVNGPSSC